MVKIQASEAGNTQKKIIFFATSPRPAQSHSFCQFHPYSCVTGMLCNLISVNSPFLFSHDSLSISLSAPLSFVPEYISQPDSQHCIATHSLVHMVFCLHHCLSLMCSFLSLIIVLPVCFLVWLVVLSTSCFIYLSIFSFHFYLYFHHLSPPLTVSFCNAFIIWELGVFTIRL